MSLQLGSILHDRYRIEDYLGKGGMGAVYLAFDQVLDLYVAVKENLNPNPESERQFLREAKLLAELRHPNLPRVTHYFTLEGRQYLVMDYIAGEDLHTRCQRQPPSVEETLKWADTICTALIYLHSRPQPVIHRDVKPANIKLQPDGTVVLVDFGLAKEHDQSATSTGARGLTPGFSPPEQYGAQRTDARSDQYSLAATIFALLTSQKPPDSIERMLKKKILKPVRAHNPAVPEYVDMAIQKAMELHQDARFADIESYQAALLGQYQVDTVHTPALAHKPPRKRRVGLIIGGAVIGLLMLGGAFLLLQGGFINPQDQITPTMDQTFVAAMASSATPTATRTATATIPSVTPSDTPVPSPSASPTTPPAPTSTAIGGGGRIAFVSDRVDDILQIWTMKPDGTDPRQLTFGPGDKSQPAWSPDGARLLFVTPGGKDPYNNDLGLDIAVMNADGTGIQWVIHSQGDDTDPTWSPDGSMIAFTSTRNENTRFVFTLLTECLDHPDGCEAETPTNVSCFLPDFCAVEFSPAWAPDGFSPPSWLPSSHNLAVAVSINQAKSQIFFRPPATVVPIDFDRNDQIVGVDHLDWSPDGSFIAFTWYYQGGINEVSIVPIEARGHQSTKLTNSMGNKEPAFSPDGNWIVFTSTRDQNYEIYVMTNNGAEEVNLTNHPGRDMQPDWQPLIN